MMYPFLTLDDATEIVHSEMRSDHTVQVYVEKPNEQDCFHHAVCILPGYTWQNVAGFDAADLSRYEEILRSTAHLILRFAQEGGFDSAASF